MQASRFPGRIPPQFLSTTPRTPCPLIPPNEIIQAKLLGARAPIKPALVLGNYLTRPKHARKFSQPRILDVAQGNSTVDQPLPQGALPGGGQFVLTDICEVLCGPLRSFRIVCKINSPRNGARKARVNPATINERQRPWPHQK